MKIGFKLLQIREERKMNQLDFSHLLEIPLTSYGRYERNESSVPIEILTALSEKLEIPIQDFFPESLSINRDNAGVVVFGKQTHNHYYGSDAERLKKKEEELQCLHKEIAELKKNEKKF